ncbi:MAG: ATP synthase subunit I [Gammaproteobacteria bacterium]|nr:MAG: ATP synthase subunit I [Gammaproteobacteria bacterium]RKZ92481.1 MAG: ATP synthase subunit I [Gammaproteobacteria bacterium]RKZ97404.1 MAG: ATP synthase subunit I [Gammaproteobacteria bacterium]
MDRLTRVQPINHLIKMQVVMLVVIVLITLWWRGNSAAIACFYGGSIAIANTLLQRWHLISSAKQAKSNAGMNLRKAYRCVAERWILTIVMFAVGFAVLNLSPLPLMTGFIMTQFALLFGIKNRA